MNKCILITGCSGGGKTALLSELKRRGCPTIEEPGRRIVKEELAGNGNALPWNNPIAFAYRAIELALKDLEAVGSPTEYTFFDRGLVDAAIAMAEHGRKSVTDILGGKRHYSRLVFLAPPWPEIFECDEERRHSFKDAIGEFKRIAAALPELGYEVCMVPKMSVCDRADFVTATQKRA
jgi:predicted ATPase